MSWARSYQSHFHQQSLTSVHVDECRPMGVRQSHHIAHNTSSKSIALFCFKPFLRLASFLHSNDMDKSVLNAQIAERELQITLNMLSKARSRNITQHICRHWSLNGVNFSATGRLLSAIFLPKRYYLSRCLLRSDSRLFDCDSDSLVYFCRALASLIASRL